MGNREQDLKDGKDIEIAFVNLLVKNNPGCTVAHDDGYNPYYDIQLIKPDLTDIKFEVKYDRMVETTGNVAIEIQYRGKDSGVVATKTDYIIYFAKGKFYWTEAKTLADRIREFEIVKGGDNNASKLILITRREFLRVFNLYT